MSLALAVGLWLAVASDPPAEVAVDVPIVFRNIPENLEISSESVPRAQIRVRGPQRVVRRLQPADIYAEIDLSGMKPGERTFDLTAQQVHQPRELEVVQVIPNQFHLMFDTRLTRQVPVRPRAFGNFAAGYQIGRIEAEPAAITISGPRKRVEAVEAAITDPIDASGTMDRATFVRHAYVSDPLVQVMNPNPVRVTVIMEHASGRSRAAKHFQFSMTTQTRQLFGTDGIRGVAGEFPLTQDSTYMIGRALGHDLKRSGGSARVVIGQDTRESSAWIADRVTHGLTSSGIEVHSAGVITTPGVAYLARSRKYAAGVVISASHNPWTDNGIKVFSGDGYKLPDAHEIAIEQEIFALLQNPEAHVDSSFQPTPSLPGQGRTPACLHRVAGEECQHGSKPLASAGGLRPWRRHRRGAGIVSPMPHSGDDSKRSSGRQEHQ